MRKITCLFICLCFAVFLKAQHCQWDGDRIIMVKVNHTPPLEDKFKIELLNSAGKPIMIRSRYINAKDSFPAVFWKNPPEGSERDYYQPQKEHFPFAKNDYYIFTDAPYREKSLKARVTYIGKNNKKYKPRIVSLPDDAVQSLCTGNNPKIWAGKVQPIVIQF